MEINENRETNETKLNESKNQILTEQKETLTELAPIVDEKKTEGKVLNKKKSNPKEDIRLFIKNYEKDIKKSIKNRDIVFIDLCEIKEFSKRLYDLLFNYPAGVIGDMSRIIKKKKICKYPTIRLTNFPSKDLIKIREIRTDNIHKLAGMIGEIHAICDVYPRIYANEFKCPGCKKLILVGQDGIKSSFPEKCECGTEEKFEISERFFKDAVDMKLKEIIDPKDKKDFPRIIKIELEEDLTDKELLKHLVLTKKVIVIGTPQILFQKNKDGSILSDCEYYFEVNNIIPLD